MNCPDAAACYVARDLQHLEKLVDGKFAGACQNNDHHHRILRVWALAHDLELHDA